MTTYNSDAIAVSSGQMRVTASEFDSQVHTAGPPPLASRPQPTSRGLSASPPPPPPQAATPLARAMNAVSTVSTTADLLQVMGQLQILLSNRYYRARHALAAIATKHTGEVEALLRRQSGESQTLKERHKDSVRKLLDLQKQVEGEMKLEIARLTAALEAAGCARAGHQHVDADAGSAA